MPRQGKGARLYWRERPDRNTAFWEIRDNGKRYSTGTADRQEAEAVLAEYIQNRNRQQSGRPLGPEQLTISQCLVYYAEEHVPHTADPARIGYAIEALDRFWGDQMVSAIKGNTCRAYAKQRTTRFGNPAAPGTIRRELNVLQAALNHCHKEGYLTTSVQVVLPPKTTPKERWLTRQEAAWLLRAARNLRIDGQHLADFILHALYTGSRKQTILSMHIDTPSIAGGHVNTVTGVLYRRPIGKQETLKRQREARLPSRYLAYLRIQARKGRRYVVEDNHGRRVGDIRKGFEHARILAAELAARKGIQIDLSDVTPHTLKHTAITWALQNGATIWDAAGYFSTSVDTIQSVYGHHSPDHQKTAVDALNRRP